MYAEIEGADPLGLGEVSDAIAEAVDEFRGQREARAAEASGL
jgi:hypothetical protein